MRVNSRGRFEFRNRSQTYNSDMNTPTVRYFPLQAGDGPTNMARDEAMLLATEQGLASFRFYTWSEATLSLGYFQPAELRLSDPQLASLPWVRRSSGGAKSTPVPFRSAVSTRSAKGEEGASSVVVRITSG